MSLIDDNKIVLKELMHPIDSENKRCVIDMVQSGSPFSNHDNKTNRCLTPLLPTRPKCNITSKRKREETSSEDEGFEEELARLEE